MQDRFKFVPVLRASLGQIDGTVKPPFAQYQRTTKTVEDNLYDFGMIFYQVRCQGWTQHGPVRRRVSVRRPGKARQCP